MLTGIAELAELGTLAWGMGRAEIPLGLDPRQAPGSPALRLSARPRRSIVADQLLEASCSR